jgi:hypothetical protein
VITNVQFPDFYHLIAYLVNRSISTKRLTPADHKKLARSSEWSRNSQQMLEQSLTPEQRRALENFAFGQFTIGFVTG